ncbi:hypothetical protein MKY30_16180 [Oceanobacillus sp. FSL W8-0428]|uniref:hypothetical protein n=1 Tax=Oceanobacillus sp. FSL W8-0428 TaxID=2921715 RepID=UPI0030F70C72
MSYTIIDQIEKLAKVSEIGILTLRKIEYEIEEIFESKNILLISKLVNNGFAISRIRILLLDILLNLPVVNFDKKFINVSSSLQKVNELESILENLEEGFEFEHLVCDYINFVNEVNDIYFKE